MSATVIMLPAARRGIAPSSGLPAIRTTADKRMIFAGFEVLLENP